MYEFKPTEEITLHRVEGYAYNIDVTATPVTRYGKPSYRYAFTKAYENKSGYQYIKELTFQIGDPKTHGINGVTCEALLAAMVHRLTGFQENPATNCSENKEAIVHMELAIEALYSRGRRIAAMAK